MKRLGLIVNPIAGMGGRVGLKGTDSTEILKRAIALGARPVAPGRAVEVFKRLSPLKEKFSLLTAPGEMGEEEALLAGFLPKVVGEIKSPTTAEDTRRVAKEMVKLGVDLLVFVGGDGTARDILDAVGGEFPVLGVPAGVKMYSAVFSASPQAAAEVIMKFLWEELPLIEAEVMDVDEEAFRRGRLSAKLYGYLMVPHEPMLVQGVKVASLEVEEERIRQEEIGRYVAELMEAGVVYVIGPGTTARAVVEALGEEKTLLGVDLVVDGKVAARDVSEAAILEMLSGRKGKIIVAPIGGQGFIFGRGNQQIGPEVIRTVGKEDVIVIATPRKLAEIQGLRVDTGDPELDESFRGHLKVITGYRESRVVKVV